MHRELGKSNHIILGFVFKICLNLPLTVGVILMKIGDNQSFRSHTYKSQLFKSKVQQFNIEARYLNVNNPSTWEKCTILSLFLKATVQTI